MDNTTSKITGVDLNVVTGVCLTADIMAILNNLVIIIILSSSSGLRDVTGVLIANQAVADLGIGLTYFVFSIREASRRFGHKILLHLSWMRYFVFIFYSESMHMVAIIAFLLCIAIVRPHQYAHSVTKKRIRIFIIVTWLFNILLSMLDLMSHTFHTDPGLPHSFVADQEPSGWWIIMLDLISLLLVPFIVTTVSLTVIFIHMRKMNMKTVNPRTAKNVQQAMAILAIAIAYMITFLPITVTQIVLKDKTKYTAVDSIVSITTLFINYFYMAFKLPLFLALFKPYWEFVKRVLGCRKRKIHDISEQKIFSSDLHTNETQKTEQERKL